MEEFTYDELYKEFCEWSPDHAKLVVDYRPWGDTSIVVWFKGGYAYKVKQLGPDRFTMQSLTKEDINRKFGLDK